MTRVYLRWGAVVLAGAALAVLAGQRYAAEVRPLTPDQLRQAVGTEQVRVIGMVQPGSLTVQSRGSDGTEMEATFELAGLDAPLPARYTGPADDNLRELKTIVIVGQINADDGEFATNEIDLVPNYGFITAAYLFGLIPLALVLFGMERRVALLYTVIKETTRYTSEVAEHEQR
jgi:cytochrome c-type biogenesis protein CcmE